MLSAFEAKENELYYQPMHSSDWQLLLQHYSGVSPKNER